MKWTSSKKTGEKKPLSLTGMIVLITLLGAVVRCFYVFNTSFPLNDGGMFYVMVRDLQANAYHLPQFTSYNGGNIPYAYPPLPFYLTAWLNQELGISLLALLRFLPLLFSIATIPIFAWLAREILAEKQPVALATLVFTLLSPVYTWQIMGGGLTRAPALFFTLAALAFLVRWCRQPNWKDWAGGVIFSALTALCHLEMLWMLALSIPVIYMYYRKDWRLLWRLFLAGIAVIALTAPWWATVVARFGFQTFFNALHSGNFNWQTPLATFLGLLPTQDLNETVFTLIALAGVLIVLRKRRSFLPVWWLVFALLDMRSGQRSMAIPLALLAGVALAYGLSWVSRSLKTGKAEKNLLPGEIDFENGWVKGLLIVGISLTIFHDLIGFYLPDTYLKSLNRENRTALAWVQANTESDSQFLVIDFPAGWHLDLVGEWFPALTERKSLLTGQGQEWLPDNQQLITVTALNDVNNCRWAGLTCLEQVAQENHFTYQYLYFTDNVSSTSGEEQPFTSILAYEVARNMDYTLVYQNEDVRIYQKK
jgi:hypothetical protein